MFGNLSQFAGVLVVYSAAHLFNCWKSFSLSWELPNAILRWMGVQDHQDLGERETKDNLLAVAAPGGRLNVGAHLGGGGPDKNRNKNKGGGGDDQADLTDAGQTDPNTGKGGNPAPTDRGA